MRKRELEAEPGVTLSRRVHSSGQIGSELELLSWKNYLDGPAGDEEFDTDGAPLTNGNSVLECRRRSVITMRLENVMPDEPCLNASSNLK